MRLALCVLVALALSFPALSAAAGSEGDRNAARALADSGLEAFDAKDYDKALTRFINAERIFHAPPHLLYIARCYDKLGRLLEAAEAYQKVIDEKLDKAPKVFKEVQQTASKELPELEARIPTLQVALTGAAEGAKVTVDGKELTALAEPLKRDPGEVIIVVTQKDSEPIQRTVTLAEGATERVEIEVKSEASDQPKTEEDEGGSDDFLIPQLVLAGVGVAGLIVGGVTGGLALSDAGELKDRCPENPCPTENESLKDSAYTMATVSTIGLVAGGVLLAGAGVWFLLMPPWDEAGDGSDKAALGLRIGPGSLGLEGAF